MHKYLVKNKDLKKNNLKLETFTFGEIKNVFYVEDFGSNLVSR